MWVVVLLSWVFGGRCGIFCFMMLVSVCRWLKMIVLSVSWKLVLLMMLMVLLLVLSMIRCLMCWVLMSWCVLSKLSLGGVVISGCDMMVLIGVLGGWWVFRVCRMLFLVMMLSGLLFCLMIR